MTEASAPPACHIREAFNKFLTNWMGWYGWFRGWGRTNQNPRA
jgi:hypothetical protein